MLFSNPAFLFLFFPFVFILFRYLPIDRVWLLIAASFVFYGFWNVFLLPLLAGSILVNFYISRFLEIEKPPKKAWDKSRWILAGGIIFNLSLLGYFKYRNFLSENVCLLYDCNFESYDLILPLGISFYTFQQISFLVDRYKSGKALPSFKDYLLFISFFPQLIAGPIVCHNEFLPQIKNLYKKTSDSFIWRGIVIFTIGLFKKVVIADQLAKIVDPVYAASAAGNSISTGEAWLSTLAFTFQIYFDFSAYSDMAIGLGLLFGIVLPINFHSPYKARNIQEFWQNWHMTLSRFLKDRIYIPLGGNRLSTIHTYRNLMFTMLVGGLWHGAHWNFVIWGGLHGIALCIHRAFTRSAGRFIPAHFLMKLAGILITFFFTTVTWVFFRAESYDSALMLLHSMFDFGKLFIHSSTITVNFRDVKYLLLLLAFIWLCPNSTQIIGMNERTIQKCQDGADQIFEKPLIKNNRFWAVITAIIFALALLYIENTQEFIYFEF